MRKVVMAVVFMAAAFAGGAVVNGPGLGWIQSLLSMVRPRDPGLVTLLDGNVTKAHESEVVVSEGIPAAPVPPLVVGPVPEEPPKAVAPRRIPPPPADSPRPKSTPPVLAQADSSPPPAPEPPKALNRKDLGTEPAQLERPATPPPAPLKLASAQAQELSMPAPKSEEDRGWGDAPGSAPAAAVLPRPAGRPGQVDPAVAQASLPSTPTRPEPESGAATAANEVWADLRRRMRELGVSRYWVEGEPDGPARFRCVIPLAGRRAVGQQFEAEGDDDLQAADAALRRVALWRATERP